jgi:two-component system sensor histidine kinase UhpB
VAIFPRDLRFAPPASLAGLGTIVLEPYPANEVAEAWSDAGLTFDILLLFFVVVLGMNMWLQRRALRPLLRLHDALADIGQGCYDTRIPDVGYVELQPVLSQFNAMAEKLARVEQQKNQLRRQLQRIQEDEGAELARDLHDEVAPFLVAVGTDAALIRHSLAAGAGDRIAGYADQIAASVTHMQRHLREILARLRHSTLAELGLRNGIEALAEFWQQRRPDIVFNLLIADIDVPEARADLAFRIVQEAVTNAIRHGNPGHVLVRIESVADALRIDIADDGQGFDMEEHRNGYGITGMIERARSAGGTLRIEKLASRGTVVRATLPDVMVGAA